MVTGSVTPERGGIRFPAGSRSQRRRAVLQCGRSRTGIRIVPLFGCGPTAVDGIGSLGSFNGIGGEGFFGEITIGYDFMFSDRFLVGAFADADYGNIGPSISAVPLIDADLENTYGFDVGARLGYLLNPNALGYVLGGYS